MDAHTGSDEGLLRKSIVSIVTIGGGCALFLSVLGTASFFVGRMGEPSGSSSSKASATSVEASPSRAPSSGSSTSAPAPTDPARKSPTAI